MAFIEKLDDKVTKWQSSKRCNLLIYSYFVNFATLPCKIFCIFVSFLKQLRLILEGVSYQSRGNPRPLPV